MYVLNVRAPHVEVVNLSQVTPDPGKLVVTTAGLSCDTDDNHRGKL